MKRITCMIADDTLFFRKIMMDICKNISLEVIKDYDMGEKLLSDLQTQETEYPDVIFLDINMPGRSGKDLLEDILEVSPETLIIMISTVSDSIVVNECLNLGAANYINKDEDLTNMKEIITSTLKMNGLM